MSRNTPGSGCDLTALSGDLAPYRSQYNNCVAPAPSYFHFEATIRTPGLTGCSASVVALLTAMDIQGCTPHQSTLRAATLCLHHAAYLGTMGNIATLQPAIDVQKKYHRDE